MATEFPKMPLSIQEFIQKQHIYFVATAAADGRVNLSPKGGDSLRILDANRVMWLNLTGSGNETAAHIRENPRMTLMFSAFEGDALIVRLYGEAKRIGPEDGDAWENALSAFPKFVGPRQIFVLDIDLVVSSCGFGVPKYDYIGPRIHDELDKHFDENYVQQGKSVKSYWQKKNTRSIDGKPTDITEE